MSVPMDTLDPAANSGERKISVSFMTEAIPTAFEPLECIEPGQQNGHINLDPVLKALQQRILRLQVSQIVLGLTLMILSAVALIEDRALFGLGFGMVSAVIAIFSAFIGIQQCSLKYVAIFNIIALLSLFPTVYFIFENLIRHSRLYIRTYPPALYLPPRFNLSHIPDDIREQYHATILNQYAGALRRAALARGPTEKPNTVGMTNHTLWILCWLELAHLVPLGATLLYLLFLYRYLNYYTHI